VLELVVLGYYFDAYYYAVPIRGFGFVHGFAEATGYHVEPRVTTGKLLESGLFARVRDSGLHLHEV
jgi:hypothetical protein